MSTDEYESGDNSSSEITYLGWKIESIDNPPKASLWFSDGGEVYAVRGGSGLSSRLIVGGQGFLDITDLILPNTVTIDLNGQYFSTSPDVRWFTFTLSLPGGGKFSATAGKSSINGVLKPLPTISKDDVAFIDQMIKDKYVPYQDIPGPQKTVEEIKKLGEQFFPFTPHGFQLAMSVYDWTTASFARLVFLKVFEYTAMEPNPFYPLNKSEVANMIWLSNWPPYTPYNEYYMRSFLMVPAKSLDDVKRQLEAVQQKLHEFSNVQNRLISAAVSALPRTSVFSKSRLFSGQVDIYQFGLDRFGTGFLECPLNSGPVTDSMTIDFEKVLSTYVSRGKIITTKMVWAFTDTVQDAIHYSNGILLVMNPTLGKVWEEATYITPLSHDYNKTEYIFPPRSRFEVLSVERTTVGGKELVIINLEPTWVRTQEDEAPKSANVPVGPLSLQEFEALAASYSPTLEEQAISNFKGGKTGAEGVIPHKTGGRWCRCVDAIKGSTA